MSKEIEVWFHDDIFFLYPDRIYAKDVETCIAGWREVLWEDCKKANADHYIYAVRTLADDDTTEQLDIYMQPLDDDEFRKRTDALLATTPAIIYAWHKGTAY